MQSVSRPPVVSCPSCAAPVEWVAASEFRPFCSARCKSNDFGAWASERYRVESADEPELPNSSDQLI